MPVCPGTRGQEVCPGLLASALSPLCSRTEVTEPPSREQSLQEVPQGPCLGPWSLAGMQGRAHPASTGLGETQ